MSKVKIIQKQEIIKHMDEAIRIMEKVDKKDAPFIAALKAIKGDGILSYDKDFQIVERLGYKFLKPGDIL